jgi:hypothetical protein
MRAYFPIFLIVLQTLTGSSHATETGQGTVVVEAAVVRLVPTLERLRQSCVVAGKYDACTNFIGFRIAATCTGDGDSWRMRVSATFRPWIVLQNIRQLSHEQEHIRDVERSVKAHVITLQRIEFSEMNVCRQRAFEETRAFGSRMKSFAAASTARRHPLPAYKTARHRDAAAGQR